MKSQLLLPLAMEMEKPAQTDVNFPELVDRVIVQPMVTKFRRILQKQFDVAPRAATEQQAAAEPPQFQPQAAAGIRLPTPANDTAFAMPEIDAKLPIPQMPGSVLKNGLKSTFFARSPIRTPNPSSCSTARSLDPSTFENYTMLNKVRLTAERFHECNRGCLR